MSTQWTPGEYAQAAGVVNAHDVMTLAAQLDPNLPTLCLALSGDMMHGSKFWAAEVHESRRAAKRFRYTDSTDKAAALDAAKAHAARRYGVTEWGTVIGIRNVLFPAAVAEAVTRTLRDGRNAVDPAVLRARFGL